MRKTPRKGRVRRGGGLLVSEVAPDKSGAKVGISVSSLASNSDRRILEHSMVVVFLELKNVALYVPLHSERQLFVVMFI